MAEVKASNTPLKEQRTGPPASQQNKGDNRPPGKKNADGDMKPNMMNNKKRKINPHNGPPNGSSERNGSQERTERPDRSGHWAPGPNGPQPFYTQKLTGAPTWELPPQNSSAQTFTGRCRLFVANLPVNVTEDSLRKLFSEFGQLSEVYIGKGNQFAFVKMDTRQNAEAAKNVLDGRNLENRTLRVRLAAHAAAIKVTNLPPSVSNELLFLAFSTFGHVERAVVVADDRGRSTNEGIVEFVRKSSALAAIKKCQSECLLLTSTPMPVVVTSLESRDEEEGVPEKNAMHSVEYRTEREYGPRFAEPGTVEFEVAKKWKQLTLIEQQRRDAFEAEMRDMHDNFKNQMEYIKIEETTKQLREQLRQMEAQSQKLNSGRETRYDMERQREEQRRQHESMLRQQEEQLIGPGVPADLNSLRRQESELRQQANALQQMLDRQETSLRSMNDPSGGPQMNQGPYGQPTMGPGPNPGAGYGPGPHGPPPGAAPMNPYAAGPAGPGMHQQHGPPPMGPHHPQMQPSHGGYGQPYGNAGGMPGHTINMAPQPYPTGPAPLMNHPGGPSPQGYPQGGLPKRNRRF